MSGLLINRTIPARELEIEIKPDELFEVLQRTTPNVACEILSGIIESLDYRQLRELSYFEHEIDQLTVQTEHLLRRLKRVQSGENFSESE